MLSFDRWPAAWYTSCAMGDDANITCPRHPKEVTALRCASCGVPICPKCLVQTPVGMKCRDCGTQRGSAVFRASLGNIACALAIGLLFGAVAGWGLAFLGLYALFLAVAYGTFAGEMILRASNRKRGMRIELIASASLVVGAIGGRMLVAALLIRSGGPYPLLGVIDVIIDLVVPSPIPLISLCIAVASAVARIRYI